MLEIAEPFRTTFDRLRLNHPEAVTSYFLGGHLPNKTGVTVVEGLLPGSEAKPVAVFFKQYDYRPAAWKFLGRPSKAQCEARSYAAFSQLGIPCAELIAWGEQRVAPGRLRSAFIVTRAIPEAVTLTEFFQRPQNSGELRAWACSRLAELTRRIHAASFFHHDLVWRNILVNTCAGKPALWWIDCPRGGFAHGRLWRQRKQIKDLASLDKSAALHCTRRERVRFLRAYLGVKKLDAQGKMLANRIIRYRRTRWPEDWTGV
jgi:tRNA A-37 threonylcarbamoyl transferase component Bud32